MRTRTFAVQHRIHFPQRRSTRTIFWSACSKCRYVGQISSKQYWPLNQQDIEQNNSLPSYQRFKTMVRTLLDQKVRARNFETSGQRRKEARDCSQWEASGKRTQGDACSFPHDDSKLGKSTRSSSPAPKTQTKSEGKSASKGRSLRGVSPSGKRSRRPCNENSDGNCTNPSRNSWHPPVCQKYKSKSG